MRTVYYNPQYSASMMRYRYAYIFERREGAYRRYYYRKPESPSAWRMTRILAQHAPTHPTHNTYIYNF